MEDNSRLIYSTEEGIVSGYFGNKKKSGKKNKNSNQDKNDGIVRVRRETKGRKGKAAVVITGLPGTSADVSEIAGQLKKKCGAGGSAKDGIVIIQGDKIDFVIKELQNKGFTVKKSGG